ncbi:hypothetical protein TNCV_1029531 [Trichonephila clavipes]|nr:hypothetical protein TNCV_1029531 [Trichonephila clavipes]
MCLESRSCSQTSICLSLSTHGSTSDASSVTENVTAPLQSQSLCPKPDLRKGMEEGRFDLGIFVPNANKLSNTPKRSSSRDV